MALLQQIFEAAVRARYMRSRMPLHRAAPAIGRGAGGCLMRALLGLVLTLLALAGAAFMFGHALLYG